MENKIVTAHEARIDNSGTNLEQVKCCICDNLYPENDVRWVLAHEAGEYMPEEEAYVCSSACAIRWVDIHFEEIDEFNEFKG